MPLEATAKTRMMKRPGSILVKDDFTPSTLGLLSPSTKRPRNSGVSQNRSDSIPLFLSSSDDSDLLTPPELMPLDTDLGDAFALNTDKSAF